MLTCPFVAFALLCAVFSATSAQQCPVTWGQTIQISNTSASAFTPKLAVVGDTVHVVYSAANIYYRRSTDGGSTWSEQILVVPDDSVAAIHNRPFVASGSNLYFVWANTIASGAYTSIKIRRSSDGGGTWLEPQLLARSQFPYFYEQPHVGSIGQKVFVTMDRISGQYSQWFTRSFNCGEM